MSLAHLHDHPKHPRKVVVEHGEGTAAAWFYEDGDGFDIFVEVRSSGDTRNTVSVRIPWRDIRGAVRRMDKP